MTAPSELHKITASKCSAVTSSKDAQAKSKADLGACKGLGAFREGGFSSEARVRESRPIFGSGIFRGTGQRRSLCFSAREHPKPSIWTPRGWIWVSGPRKYHAPRLLQSNISDDRCGVGWTLQLIIKSAALALHSIFVPLAGCAANRGPCDRKFILRWAFAKWSAAQDCGCNLERSSREKLEPMWTGGSGLSRFYGRRESQISRNLIGRSGQAHASRSRSGLAFSRRPALALNLRRI